LAILEATVRTLVSSSKGSITGTSRTADGSRIVITVDEATADSLTRNIESVLGANVSIEPMPMAPPAMASAKAAVAARALPKADTSDAELTLSQLEKRLADQQAKREELLKDFYEDAKPVKSLDAEIQDTKSQIERKKRATKANKLNFVVILKPVKQ
jgi:septal ring factor EnvC (AmiA/AmiB activator)